MAKETTQAPAATKEAEPTAANGATQAPVTAKEAGSAGKAKSTLAVGQTAEARLRELRVKELKGLLTVDEVSELKNIEKQMEDANTDTDAETNQLKDDDVRDEDPEKGKFSEQDVIQYMYEKWLIAGAEWCGQKIEKGCGTAYEKLRRRTLRQAAERKLQDETFKNSKTYTSFDKVNKEYEKKFDEIKNKADEKKKSIYATGSLLNKGDLSDPKNAAILEKMIQTSSTSSDKNIVGYLKDAAQSAKEKNKLEKELEQAKKVLNEAKKYHAGSKNDGAKKQSQPIVDKAQQEVDRIQKEVNKKQKEVCAKTSKYIDLASRTLEFKSSLDTTAARMAAAAMMQNIAKNPDAYDKLDTTFKETFDKNKSDLTAAVKEDRKKYVNNEKIKYDPNIASYNGNSPRPPKTTMGRLETYNDLAKEALDESTKNIISGKAKEFNKVPDENKSYKSLTGYISNRLDRINESENDKDSETPEQLAAKAAKDKAEREAAAAAKDKAEREAAKAAKDAERDAAAKGDGKPQDLKAAAAPSKNLDNLNSDLASNNRKMNDVVAKEQEHRNSPTAKRAEAFRKKIERKTMKQLKNAGFKPHRDNQSTK